MSIFGFLFPGSATYAVARTPSPYSRGAKLHLGPLRCYKWLSFRARNHQTRASDPVQVPLRKQLKDEAKRKRTSGQKQEKELRASIGVKSAKWELTIGIEVHAQLNSSRKLFSEASTIASEKPNSNVAPFDLALPGSQPVFQSSTLLPALRAAIALKCEIMRVSKFDRKHYFYQDQPAGYQITQFYSPFAKDGHIVLHDHDGIAVEDGKSIQIGIKQIQMEQDTAKTVLQPPDMMLIDFNRAGYPLIEIITLPQIHHPQTAAACVRKIQSILQAVNSVTTGMEMGGLRADVNVSVRAETEGPGIHSYHGISGLGQRTEIKNLSSFKAIENSIVAERDRQISILEGGGTIEGETRGWTIGSTETTRLRGKEGEVDYRYMPDPDIPPVVIGPNLIDHLQKTLPILPDKHIHRLIQTHGLTLKDSKTIVALDNGDRLKYFYDVVTIMNQDSRSKDSSRTGVLTKNVQTKNIQTISRMVANWTLHELGGLLSASATTDLADCPVSPSDMATILHHLTAKAITGPSAKQLLALKFHGDARTVDTIITDDNLALQTVSADEYRDLARVVIRQKADVVDRLRRGGAVERGKVLWLVGQMMRREAGGLDPVRAREAVEEVLAGEGERGRGNGERASG